VEPSRSYGSSNEHDESRHFETIFEWLREAKGVSRILRVVVDDDHDTPHDDAVIEEALNGFQVEVWDWKRYDICIDVIQRVSASVRVVHLYSTGNLAVLLNWSSVDGLGILPQVSLSCGYFAHRVNPYLLLSGRSTARGGSCLRPHGTSRAY
jgi:hypothetical protein